MSEILGDFKPNAKTIRESLMVLTTIRYLIIKDRMLGETTK